MLRNKSPYPNLPISKSQYPDILISCFRKLGDLGIRIWSSGDWEIRICALCLFWILCFDICHLSFAQEEFIYDAKGKRNPFIPLVTPDGRLLKVEEKENNRDELSLEGIIYDKYGLSYAIVNGEVVKIGDKLGNYQVLKIEENKIIFLKEGKPLEVELKREGE